MSVLYFSCLLPTIPSFKHHCQHGSFHKSAKLWLDSVLSRNAICVCKRLIYFNRTNLLCSERKASFTKRAEAKLHFQKFKCRCVIAPVWSNPVTYHVIYNAGRLDRTFIPLRLQAPCAQHKSFKQYPSDSPCPSPGNLGFIVTGFQSWPPSLHT